MKVVQLTWDEYLSCSKSSLRISQIQNSILYISDKNLYINFGDNGAEIFLTQYYVTDGVINTNNGNPGIYIVEDNDTYTAYYFNGTSSYPLNTTSTASSASVANGVLKF